VPEAHTCNPAAEEVEIRKPVWVNSLRDSILKIPNTKMAGGVAQGIGPEFKPQYQGKKNQLIWGKFITTLKVIGLILSGSCSFETLLPCLMHYTRC
jgi:hypothetical protein